MAELTKFLCTLPGGVAVRYVGLLLSWSQWALWRVISNRVPPPKLQYIDSNQILLSDKDQQINVVGCAPGTMSATYDFLVCVCVCACVCVCV